MHFSALYFVHSLTIDKFDNNSATQNGCDIVPYAFVFNDNVVCYMAVANGPDGPVLAGPITEPVTYLFYSRFSF